MDEGDGLLAGLGGFSEGRMVGLMGTDVRVLAWAGQQEEAEMAQQAAFDEMVRLQSVFSIHDADSELSRWARGEAVASLELDHALALAAHWHRDSGGALNPACRPLYRRWERAAAEGVLPGRGECQALARGVATLPWTTGPGGRQQRVSDCTGVDLYSFVKGLIVDLAVSAARAAAPGLRRLGVNAGGDLRHQTDGDPWRVGVEDPRHPSDNGAHRLCTLAIGNQAVATSGLARRGFRVAGQWFGHVIDPRTGWPVDHLAQVTVVAPDAATADALATVCGVLPLDEGIAVVEAAAGCQALAVPTQDDHPPLATTGWQSLLA